MITELKHKLLLGFRGMMLQIPLLFSEKGLRKGAKGAKEVADSLSGEERRVHHYIVKKMAVVKDPVTIDMIAEGLEMNSTKISNIVNTLENKKLFIYRSAGKGIDWAFPFSLQNTGFIMSASTGERFFAA